MIRFPNPHLFRLVSRSAILAVAIIFFPWLLTTVLLRSGESVATNDVSFFPELLRDLSSLGLLNPDFGHAGFLGDSTSKLPLLIENRLGPINEEGIVSDTLDLVFVAGDNFGFLFANRALKVGGIAVIVSTDSFMIPPNFRMVYIRRFSSTVMAIRKIVEDPETVVDLWQTRRMGRRLLTVPEAKREALKGLEDLALEPPPKGRLQKLRRTRYLPDLLETSLTEYPRRVFVDVESPGRAGSDGWFAREYPTRGHDFEIIRVEIAEDSSSRGAGSMTEWLSKKAREEDFVVMKAEAEAVEEMVKGRTIALVDELFLECRNQWQKGRSNQNRRAYWECLALCGNLRDDGVAVHLWRDVDFLNLAGVNRSVHL